MTYQALDFECAPARGPRAGMVAVEVPLIPIRWLACALALSAAAVAAMMLRNHLLVQPASRVLAGLVGAACLFALLRYRTRAALTTRQRRLRDFSENVVLLIAICILGAVASYETATDTTGFYDATLAHADRMMHFDWLSWYVTVVRHPVLQYLGEAAYGSVWVTPWVLIAWQAWHGHQGHARQFLLTFWLSIVLTLALFPLFPARGALQFLWHGPIPYMPVNGLYQGEIIPLLRSHALTLIDLDQVKGIVCAPSFHTVCAVVFIASVWPVGALRRWLVPLNCAMLLATPVEGTHYLVDMVMGLGVALTAILVVRLGAERLGRLPDAALMPAR